MAQAANIIAFPKAPDYPMRVPQGLDPETQEIVAEINTLAGYLKREVRYMLEAIEAIDKRLNGLRDKEMLNPAEGA